MTKKKKPAEPDGQGVSFEAAIERLEEIVSKMEAGQLGLDEMMGCFEEGQKLVRFCSGKLNEVEKKIEILVKRGDNVEAEPFDADSADEEAPPEDRADGAAFRDPERLF